MLVVPPVSLLRTELTPPNLSVLQVHISIWVHLIRFLTEKQRAEILRIFPIFKYLSATDTTSHHCLSQDLETGCLKLPVVKFLCVQIFKGDRNIIIFQP